MEIQMHRFAIACRQKNWLFKEIDNKTVCESRWNFIPVTSAAAVFVAFGPLNNLGFKNISSCMQVEVMCRSTKLAWIAVCRHCTEFSTRSGRTPCWQPYNCIALERAFVGQWQSSCCILRTLPQWSIWRAAESRAEHVDNIDSATAVYQLHFLHKGIHHWKH